MANILSDAKAQIHETAKMLKEEKMLIDFQGQLELATALSNQINFYLLLNSKDTQNVKFEILPLYNFFFSGSFQSELSIFFSSILISAFTDQSLSNITDFGSFFSKFKQFFSSIFYLKNKEFDILANYSAKCFASFFNCNHALFVETLEQSFLPLSPTNDAKFATFVNFLQFPSFSAKEEISKVIKIICNTSFSDANSFMLTKFVDFLSNSNQIRSILPHTISENGKICEILQFLVNILLENEQNNISFNEFLEYFDFNRSIVPTIVLIIEKYFILSKSKTILEDFNMFLQKDKNILFKFNFSHEIFDRLAPPDTDWAFDVVRHLTRYSISHIYDNNLISTINFLKQITKFCLETEESSKISNNKKDISNHLVDFLNSSPQENCSIKYFPFHKVERFCFYSFFREDDPEVRLAAFELLYQISQYFEKVDEDWENYELASQPFYHQFSNEIGFYINKNKDKDMEIHDFISKCDPKEALCMLARRTTVNRPEFASKVLQESLTFCKKQHFMIKLLMCTLTPILLRYFKNKKVRFDLKQIYQLVRSNDVEALSLIDTSYLIECLKFVTSQQPDFESFNFLTKSALNNVSQLKADQIIHEINVLNSFLNDNSKVSDVSDAVLNIVSQLEQTNELIDLSLLASIPSKLFNSRNLMSELSSAFKSFIAVSEFLMKHCVNFDILFIENCDINYFNLAISNYPSKKDEIIETALHFIPKIVAMYFFTKSKSSLEEVAIPFLLSPPKILDSLLISMYPYLDNSEEFSIISAFANNRKLTDFCINFFNSPFSERIGFRVMNLIKIIGLLHDDNECNNNKDKINYIKIFMKYSEIAPWSIFFSNERDSYFLFKYLIEFGASPSIIDLIVNECQFMEQISEKLLTEESTYFVTEITNRSSLKSFEKLLFNPINNNDDNDVCLKNLSKCKNINAFKLLIKKHTKSYKLYSEILSSNHSLNFFDIALIFVNEFTKQFVKTASSNSFNPTITRTFFDTCLKLIHLGNSKITSVIYNFVSLIYLQFNDPVFIADLIKLVVFDDKFYSLIEKSINPTNTNEIRENAILLPIHEVTSNEAIFWINIIKGNFTSFDLSNPKFFRYIEKCLEFDSTILKHKCLEFISRFVLMPYTDISDINLIKFVQFLTYSPTADPEFSIEFLNSIEGQLGQISTENDDFNIESSILDPSNICNLFY